VPDVSTDPVLFARRILRMDLWPHQVEAILSNAFISVVSAARRTGKTTMVEVLAIYTAFANPGCTVVILSATRRLPGGSPSQSGNGSLRTH
jgi:hypothetical protein